jgi:hypothetical protein
MTTLIQLPTLGRVVLVDERKPDLSYRLLQERAQLGRKVLCITREPPERVARRYPLDGAEHYWLVSQGDARAVSPFDLEAIARLIEAFVRRHRDAVILLDGVELLMVMNSYEEVRRFLDRVQGALREEGAGCIIPIDTRTLTSLELSELKGSFPMVHGFAVD